MPTSRRLETRPNRSMRPSVGSVMRLRIFSSVDFPAPFFPIRPITSARPMLNEMSFNAQNGSARRRRRALREGRFHQLRDAFPHQLVRGVLFAETIGLADALRDDRVVHHITSAKTRSVCLK